jgi:hypothetical protein
MEFRGHMKSIYTSYNIEELQNNLLNGCMNGKEDLVQDTLNLARHYNLKLDLSYDEGFLAVVVAQKGYTAVLKIIDEYDSSLIKKYGIELLGQAAVNGQMGCVEFLLSKQIDPALLKGTSAYNNYAEVEQLFDQHKYDDVIKTEMIGNSCSNVEIEG